MTTLQRFALGHFARHMTLADLDISMNINQTLSSKILQTSDGKYMMQYDNEREQESRRSVN